VRERLEREFYYLLDFEGQILLYIKRAGRTDPVVAPILREKGLPDDLKFVPVAESGLLFRAQSHTDALGYWQFMKATGKAYGLRIDGAVDDRRSLPRSTRAAAAYLKDLHKVFGSWPTALAGYNWGEKNLLKAVKTQGTRDYYDLYLPVETERFVFRIITLKLIMEDPAGYAIQIPQERKYRPPAEANVTLKVQRQAPIDLLSTCAHTSPRNVRYLNPWMMDNTLPAGTYTFTVPAGKEAGFQQCMKKRRTGKKEIVHVVKQGESLGRIAEKYGVRVRDLEAWNQISTKRPIRPGQRLRIEPGD
jgi:hypothetical protein